MTHPASPLVFLTACDGRTEGVRSFAGQVRTQDAVLPLRVVKRQGKRIRTLSICHGASRGSTRVGGHFPGLGVYGLSSRRDHMTCHVTSRLLCVHEGSKVWKI